MSGSEGIVKFGGVKKYTSVKIFGLHTIQPPLEGFSPPVEGLGGKRCNLQKEAGFQLGR